MRKIEIIVVTWKKLRTNIALLSRARRLVIFTSPTDFSFEVFLSKLELKTKKVAMNKITSYSSRYPILNIINIIQ